MSAAPAGDIFAGTEMAEVPNLFLRLESRPENVLLARQALTGVAEAAGVDALELNDMAAVLSEACNNVVQHAYGGGCGPLEIELRVRRGGVRMLVRDRGIGVPEGFPEGGAEALTGIGVPLMLALTERAEFTPLDTGGTEVLLDFATSGTHELGPPDDGEATWSTPPGTGADDGAIVLDIAPPGLSRTVLPRVLSTLAAGARFSTDAIADAQLLADALAAHAACASGASRLSLQFGVNTRALDIRVWPIPPGRLAQLLLGPGSDGLGATLDRLADGYEVLPDETMDVLAVQFSERRQIR